MSIVVSRLWIFVSFYGAGCLLAAACLGVASAPANADSLASASAQAALQPANSAAAPNCLLPGQIRTLGGIAQVTPRRAVTLAPADCAVRGGEPIVDTATATPSGG